MSRLAAMLAAAIVTGAPGAEAQQIPTEPGPPVAADEVRDAEGGPDERQVVVVPIPQTDPALGAGLTAVAMMLYRPEGAADPWTTGAGALYTDSRSWAVGGFQRANLLEGRLRLTGLAGYGDFNIDFYGVGGDAGSSGRSVGLNQSGATVMAQSLWEVAPDWFVGPRLRVVSIRTTLTTPVIPALGIDPADLEIEGVSASLGISTEYDTRDSEYGPRQGVYGTAEWMRATEALGSDFEYDHLQASLNAYRPLGPETVLAGRAYYCSASEDAPFFDLCLFGAHNDLRGYSSGQYRDHEMYAVQVEVRRHLFGRLGAVAFAGVGGISPDRSWDEATTLPAAGVGLRFEASREYRVNLSVDVAVGDGSSGLYVYLGEAF